MTWEEARSVCAAQGSGCTGIVRYSKNGGTYNDGDTWWYQACVTSDVSPNSDWEFITWACLDGNFTRGKTNKQFLLWNFFQ